jgi:hypothetical protein
MGSIIKGHIILSLDTIQRIDVTTTVSVPLYTKRTKIGGRPGNKLGNWNKKWKMLQREEEEEADDDEDIDIGIY